MGNDDKLYALYKCLTNLPFINSEYIFELFNFIKSKSENNEHFKDYLKYFKDNYLIKYDVGEWNYYDNIENTTNNCCESYHNKLNNYLIKNLLF